MKDFELIEHTADIGIRVQADDLKGLFEKAALAMFNIIGQLAPLSLGPTDKEIPPPRFNIRQTAETPEELFINWLNELLSLSATKELMFTNIIIHKLDKNSLEVEVFGEDIKIYKINTEIKAATYHELKLEETESGWIAEVIFDV
ncbi:MAG: archease [Candidatus Omnitrophota bacterium]